jgi:hypothetical protein
LVAAGRELNWCSALVVAARLTGCRVPKATSKQGVTQGRRASVGATRMLLPQRARLLFEGCLQVLLVGIKGPGVDHAQRLRRQQVWGVSRG